MPQLCDGLVTCPDLKTVWNRVTDGGSLVSAAEFSEKTLLDLMH